MEALYEEIAAWTRGRTKQEAMRELGEAGVPCSATFDTLELFTDPHLAERDFIQTVQHPYAGEIKLMRNPMRMSGSNVPLRAAPVLGSDTARVLREDAGLTEAEIAGLVAASRVVVAQNP
jgi:formyl-CoA transferase